MSTQKSILIIEDDPLLLNLYHEVFTNAGYQVETASDGQQGYQKILQNKYHLILLDMFLPGLTGQQIIDQIQQENPNTLTLRNIIVLSNTTDEQLLQHLLEQGVKEVLVKTNYTPQELLKKIQPYL